MTDITDTNTSESPPWPLPGGRKVFALVLFLIAAMVPVPVLFFSADAVHYYGFLTVLCGAFFGANTLVHRAYAPKPQDSPQFDHPPTSHADRGF